MHDMPITKLPLTKNAEAVRRKLNETIDAVNEGGGGGGAASWGGITGTLSAQTDLASALSGKANTGHGHSIANVTGLQDALDSKLDSSAIAVNQTTVDFGAFAYNAVVSVSDASVTGSTRVMANITIGSGRDADELEMAPMTIAHKVKSGIGIDFYIYALQGADGQFTINYTKA